jgi:Ran GTPase-activating protein (RanGAP) involved in mRNA processing and transport
VGEAGASAFAAALDRGALPRLESLVLMKAAIGDAALVALAPALRRRPALEALYLCGNPFGDEGLAALLAPPPPAGTPPLPTGGLKKLKLLDLRYTEMTDAGCAALATALDSSALPALVTSRLNDIPASAAAIEAVREALERSRAEALARVDRAAIAASAARELGRRRSQRLRGGERGIH